MERDLDKMTDEILREFKDPERLAEWMQTHVGQSLSASRFLAFMNRVEKRKTELDEAKRADTENDKWGTF